MAKGDNEPVFSKFSKVDQIGIIVKDVEATMKFYKEMFGIESLPAVDFELGFAKLRVGMLRLGELQIELIQVLEGKSIHSKFIEERGGGLHHLGFFVEDVEKELARLGKYGIKVLEKGEAFGVKFAYLDTEKTLGFVLELLQLD